MNGAKISPDCFVFQLRPRHVAFKLNASSFRTGRSAQQDEEDDTGLHRASELLPDAGQSEAKSASTLFAPAAGAGASCFSSSSSAGSSSGDALSMLAAAAARRPAALPLDSLDWAESDGVAPQRALALADLDSLSKAHRPEGLPFFGVPHPSAQAHAQTPHQATTASGGSGGASQTASFDPQLLAFLRSIKSTCVGVV